MDVKDGEEGPSWEAAAARVPREEGVSKSEWKRRVRKELAQERRRRKEGRKGHEATPPKEPRLPKKKERVPERPVALIFDCFWEQFMSRKALISLAGQIRDSYGANRAMERACRFVVSLPESSNLLQQLKTCHNIDRWSPFELSHIRYFDIFPPGPHLIYLSSEGEETLHDIEDESILIIGGLVDRNNYKGCTHAHALERKVRTMRLPLDTFQLQGGTRITCNQVVELICLFLSKRDAGIPLPDCWRQSAAQVLPRRRVVV